VTASGSPFDRRRSGILLHPTSLPGGRGNGDFGAHAYRFVDWLEQCRQSVWQVLPLGATHSDGSPYQCLSLHAGNPLLIDIYDLIANGWLTEAEADDIFAAHAPDFRAGRRAILSRAWQGFQRSADDHARGELARYVDTNKGWLDDYALYDALRCHYDNRAWCDWPVTVRNRQPAAMRKAQARYRGRIEQNYFEQFLFHRHWQRLRSYANDKGILIFGDMPIFVAYDSVDVWAHRECFQLDSKGQPTVVAGVPPDYFSATGQRWGNPHYRWEYMQQQGFKWWSERIAAQLEFFDLVRIDHFRGFEAFWEVPADQDTAMNGRWIKAPGAELFSTLEKKFGRLPLVAEDLGLITPEVDALRRQFGFPGMKILQFAFEGGARNPYLPHNHEPLAVVYTGTHDNDTTLGWWQQAGDSMRDYVTGYLCNINEPQPWPLVRCALASVARLAVIPMQDILMLGSEARMNTPGTSVGNWAWRFTWEQLDNHCSHRLHHYTELYGRC